MPELLKLKLADAARGGLAGIVSIVIGAIAVGIVDMGGVVGKK